MDIKLDCKEVAITPNGFYTVSVKLEDVKLEDILDCLTIEDVVKYFGARHLLDEIGEDECKTYFHLTEVE